MYPSTGIMLFYPLLLRKRRLVVRADGHGTVRPTDYQPLDELLGPHAMRGLLEINQCEVCG